MSKHGPIRAERPTPSRARLIHHLIEERAKVLALRRGKGFVGHIDRDQARREIEDEVLTTPTKANS